MKFFISCLLLMTVLSCGKHNKDVPQNESCHEISDKSVTHSVSNDNKEPVYMTLPQTTLDKNVGTVTLTLFNTSKNLCITGDEYFIEKNDGEQWVKFSLRNAAYDDIAISVSPETSKDMSVDLSNVKVKYSSGQYRVGKRIRIQSENGYRDTVCYCNFYIR